LGCLSILSGEKGEQLEEKNRKRSEDRSVFTAAFEFRRNPGPEADRVQRSFSGVIANKSQSGLGFYSSLSLRAGEELTVFCHQINTAPMRAQVRWCKKLSSDLFKTGVCFV
jgi:hypothetical protein